MNLSSETYYNVPGNDVDTQSGHYGQFPRADIPRSRYKVPFRNTFTCNASYLVPFYWSYVMPNETFSLDTTCVIRMQPTVHSPMSNVFADIFYFFVSGKDLWTDDGSGSWKRFFGEIPGAYTPTPLSTYTIPQVSFPSSTGFSPKSVADYLGVPPGVDPSNNQTISALPFRAYAMCWNSWIRDENLSPEALVYTGSSTQTGATITGNPLNTAALGGDLLPVCRVHDMLGSCLPFPQKGDPLDSAVKVSGAARVLTYDNMSYPPVTNWSVPLEWTGLVSANQQGLPYVTSSANHPTALAGAGSISPSSTTISPSNLWLVTGANSSLNYTIDSIRTSIALQHYFEALARGGSRYQEVISSLYGTTINPLELDRPMYLGGKRIPISITNVIQNTPTGSGTSGLGAVAGYSCTSDHANSFTTSFQEHGIVIGCLAIRSEPQFQEALDRNWKLKDRLEFYTPQVFDGLGEMEVLNSDIYLKSSDSGNVNNDVFGYQEAYYWERYRPFVVSGEFRSSYSSPLDSWHLADHYTDTPTLAGYVNSTDGVGWIYDNTVNNLDRVLQVTSSVSDQFYVDLYIDNTVVSPLPVYSIPGISTL